MTQLRAQLGESEQRSQADRQRQLTQLKQQLAEQSSEGEAKRVATKDERQFAFTIIQQELAKSSDQGGRAEILLFLARAGILNSLNRAELEKMATEQIKRAGREVAGIPPTLGKEFHLSDVFTPKENWDIFGHDIVAGGEHPGFKVLDINACALICSGMPRCAAYSFDHESRWCYLKDAVPPSALLDPRSSIGVRKPSDLPKLSASKKQLEWLGKKRIKDDEVGHQRTADLEQCGNKCMENEECLAFTFLKDADHQTDNCLAFSAAHNVVEDRSAESGFKWQSPDRTVRTNNTTPTSSATLNFAFVPSWIVPGMTVQDTTTPGAITGSQKVQTTTGKTVVLSADVNATVENGDMITFFPATSASSSN
jgi:hypothetical protein